MNSDSDSNSSTEYGAFLGDGANTTATVASTSKIDRSKNATNHLKPARLPHQHHTTTYRAEWEHTFPWLRPFPDNCSYARCIPCESVISISHGGANDIKRHADTAKHKKLVFKTEDGDGEPPSTGDQQSTSEVMIDIDIKPQRRQRKIVTNVNDEKRRGKRSFAPRKQYFITYNPDWEQDYPWVQADPANTAMAHCKVCQSIFSIEYRGIHDVSRHLSRLRHQKAVAKLRDRGLDVSGMDGTNLPTIKKRKQRQVTPDSTQKFTKNIKQELYRSSDEDGNDDDDEYEDDDDDTNYNSALYWDSFMTKSPRRKSSMKKEKKPKPERLSEDEDAIAAATVAAASVSNLNDPFECVNINESLIDFDDDYKVSVDDIKNENDDDYDDDDVSNNDDDDYAPAATEKKSPKLFNPKWSARFPWAIQSARKGNCVECTICYASIPLVKRGTADLILHETRKRHIKQQNHRNLFPAPPPPPPPQKSSPTKPKLNNVSPVAARTDVGVSVKRAELLLAHHHITTTTAVYDPNHSECCMSELLRYIYQDSALAQRINYSPSNMNRIVNTVFVPAISQQCRIELAGGKHPFSIATHTQEGSIQPAAFPLLLRYFTSSTGLQTRLLAFISPETADSGVDIAAGIRARLQAIGLSIDNVTTFTANNSDVNFDHAGNVFAELQTRNEHLLPTKCYHESIREMFRSITFHFPIDMETTIIRCMSELRSFRQCPVGLPQDAYVWSASEWLDIFDEWPITAASLLPATAKLLAHFQPLKTYFRQKSRSTPIILLEFFNHPLAECYLCLYRLVGFAMQSICRRLSANASSAIDLYDAFSDCRNIMRRRMNEDSYAQIMAQQRLNSNSHTSEGIQQFAIDARQCFSNGLTELDGIFACDSSNIYRHLSVLRLSLAPPLPPQFDDFVAIVRAFQIGGIDETQLRQECHVLADYYDMNRLTDANGDVATAICAHRQGAAAMEWWKVFLKLHPLPNLERICGWVFSLPMSNGEAAGVRADMVKLWRDASAAGCSMSFGQRKNDLIVRHSFGALDSSGFAAMLDNSAGGEKMIKKWMASS